MPDTRISDLATGTTVVSGDWFVYVDVSDTSMAATGTDKKLSPAVLLAGLGTIPVTQGGTGLVTAGAANQILGVTPTGTGLEYKTLTAGANVTITPVAGSITIASTGGGGGGLSAINNNLILANISGASAIPIGDTLTQIIDSAIGNVQGSVLYRDSAAWLALPPGINGQALASQGPAANPHWITLGGGTGTLTSVAAGAGLTASPSPITAAGTLSIPNSAITYSMHQNEAASTLLGNPTGSSAAPSEITLGPALLFMGSSLRSRVPIWAATGPGTALTSSAALTNILAGAPSIGSLTIPANTLQVGSRLSFELFGTYFWTSGAVTLYVEIDLDAIVIAKSPLITIGTSVSGNSWAIDHAGFQGFQIQATGVSGKIIGGARFAPNGNSVLPLNTSGLAFQAPTQVTIDTTVAHTIAVKLQWSVAAATYGIQLLGGGIYLDG